MKVCKAFCFYLDRIRNQSSPYELIVESVTVLYLYCYSSDQKLYFFILVMVLYVILKFSPDIYNFISILHFNSRRDDIEIYLSDMGNKFLIVHLLIFSNLPLFT